MSTASFAHFAPNISHKAYYSVASMNYVVCTVAIIHLVEKRTGLRTPNNVQTNLGLTHERVNINMSNDLSLNDDSGSAAWVHTPSFYWTFYKQHRPAYNVTWNTEILVNAGFAANLIKGKNSAHYSYPEKRSEEWIDVLTIRLSAGGILFPSRRPAVCASILSFSLVW